MPRARDRTVTPAPTSPVSTPHATTDRRAFLERLAGVSAALAVTPVLTTLPRTPTTPAWGSLVAPTTRRGGLEPGPWNDAWLDKLTGKHKQFFDTLDPNEGFSLAFTLHFLNLNREAYGLGDRDLTAVVGLRHFAMPMALPDAIWNRYRIGESMQIKDPATGGPATRNPFLHADGVPVAGADIPSLMKRNVLFTACNVALTTLSGSMAKNAGVSKDAAQAEWTAMLVPGMILVPVGVMAVNLAQERGCSYCYGG
jgi:hypothetical protein